MLSSSRQQDPVLLAQCRSQEPAVSPSHAEALVWWCPGEVGKQGSRAGLPSWQDELVQQAAFAEAVARCETQKGTGLIGHTTDPMPSQTVYI